jgi:hypothetical protein
VCGLILPKGPVFFAPSANCGRQDGDPRESFGASHYDIDVRDAEKRIGELESSNAELRATLMLAGRELRRLTFGKRDTPLMKLMRRSLREARVVVRRVPA